MHELDREHDEARPGSVRRMETALRESEERLRTVITGAPIVLFALDESGVFTLSEGQGLTALGLRPGEVVGRSVFEVYRESPSICDAARRALAGESQHTVVEFGDMAWDLRYSPQFDERGEPAGAIGVATNVSEQRRAERALAALEARYRALVENAAVGIWQVTTDGRTMYANPHMLALLEVEDPSALSDVTINRFFTEESLALVSRERPKRFRGEASTYQVRMVTWLGNVKDVEVSGAPVVDADGALVSLIGAFVDVSERKRAEDVRLALELQVQQALRRESLGRLAGGIAHDFNNLQTAILGNASLARQRLAPDAKESLLLARVEDAARRAAQLTNQMLAYAGKGRYEVAPLDLSVVTGEMRELLEAAGMSRVRVSYALHESLPAIDADPSQMQQVLLSLVTNACESFGGSEGEVVVRTGTSESGSGPAASDRARYVVLEVADRGKGIDAKVRDKIFDPFYTTKAAGRGMGLAAVLGIVNGHRGTIAIEDRPGGGTTVRVLFPVSNGCAGNTEPPTRETEPSRETAADPRASTRTILVVDDEDIVRDIVCLTLEKAGYQVLGASSGEGGLRIVEERGADLDLVVLDLTMIGLSGAQTLGALRKRLPDIPVLLVSGYAREDPGAEFPVDGGRCAFLQKPFHPADLQAKVAEVLSNGTG